MINKNKKTVFALMLIVVTILLIISNVYAFGVSSSYYKGNPLQISPGETKIISLRLQNMVGSEDMTVKSVLTKGSEIAKVEEKNYVVKAGTEGLEVPVTISISSNTPLNTNYEVTVSFSTVTSGQGGAVSLGTGIDTTFDVLVVPETPNVNDSGVNNSIVFLVVGVIVLLAIIVLAVFLKNKKTKTK